MTFTLNPSLITVAQVTPVYSIPFPLKAYGENITLVRVTRIVIESVALYLLQQITLLFLYFFKHPAQVVFFDMLLPMIGIVFLLMVLRTQSKQAPGGIRSQLIVLPTLTSASGTGLQELTVLSSHKAASVVSM
ncbi:hypothetical protein FA15DRAFT_732655 [Coprinopsis marcescibilis]|uniref:Uncharacterized protein n=1 Tax=Coprinopsis marcescibilis TaxID=230819 RepID=A0A5C3KDA3_COPMA|nr:hypothetical protein FA15DRAFT_732655 [Coprinopsis marcescibilis]